ncbi:peptide/nickel transport system substrate-binding protein [Bacillus tianshenii]|uniref:Peptide/nickel transport system substrate-binding protein n=1 Tax=Sutcliffiella tianshenii TaxID=1463404 RepID=A0ABS2NV69_9BACI|nr:nickel ABC transporter substrate-binding protein [Bacillus tianshenii]MBM7618544.1 peptide/nickel transport system substrate-binding protein [Bacillus tianshenii]
MKNFKHLLILMMCLIVIMTGCSTTQNSSQQQDGKEKEKNVTMIFSFKAANLDPHTGFIPIRAGITETLLKLDEESNIEGWLAEKWNTEDNVKWEFTIRDDVQFQDGKKLDAESVKQSLERSLEANVSLGGSLKIESIEADGQMLTIHTTEPYPALPSELVNPYTSIVNMEAAKKAGEEAFRNNPVGTGPFKVKTFKANQEVVVEKNESYWAGEPKVDGATIKFNEDANVRALALQSKEADVVYNLPAESLEPIEKDKDLKVVSIPGLRAHFILYNSESAKVEDVKVREALDLLLDRKSVAKDIMLGHGLPANGPFNSTLPFGLEDKVKELDVDKAKQLLSEVGYKENAEGKMEKDGQPLTLELITYKARPELPLIAQLLQSDAAKAGITIEIKTVENADTHLSENKDWDLATYSNNTSPRGDGSYFFQTAFTETGALNVGKINIPELNQLIEELNRTTESEERTKLTKEAAKVINEEVAHSYAVYPNIIIGMNKRITNWKPTAEEYYILTHTLDVK